MSLLKEESGTFTVYTFVSLKMKQTTLVALTIPNVLTKSGAAAAVEDDGGCGRRRLRTTVKEDDDAD